MVQQRHKLLLRRCLGFIKCSIDFGGIYRKLNENSRPIIRIEKQYNLF